MSPKLNAEDLMHLYSYEENGKTYDVYQWQDSTVFLMVDKHTSEVCNIWEE